MPSSGMLHCVDLVRTNVLVERIASIIRVTRIGKLGTMLAVTSNVFWFFVTVDVPSLPILITVMMEVICSSETSNLTRTTWHNISEDSILQPTI
jgi:hypothetical protein